MPEPVRYTFGPLDQSAFILGLRLGQVSILTSSATLGMLLMLASHGSVLAAGLAGLLVLTGLALAILPVNGRGVDEWVPVLLRWGIAPRAWRSSASWHGHTVGTRGAVIETQSEMPPALRGLTIVTVDLPGGQRIGVLRDPARGTYTGVVRVVGSSYALLSEQEKAAQLAAWGGALSSLAHHGSPIETVQLVVRNVAEDPDGIARYLEEGATLDHDTSVFRSYLRLVDAAAPATQAQEVFVAVTISNRRAGKAIAAAGGHDTGGATVLVRQLVQLQTQLNRAQITAEGVLPPRLLAQVVREAFDPQAAHALRRRSSGDPRDEGVALNGAGPQALRTAWRHFTTDGGCVHTTYWINEWPRVDVGPNFLIPLLLQSTARLTFAVTMAPVDPTRAQRELDAAQTAHLSDEMLRSKHGFRTSITKHRQADAIERREREFADGHGEYRFSGYLTVTAGCVEELDAACGEVEQQARNSRLDVRRMDGEHDLAFTYTLPLGRGLR